MDKKFIIGITIGILLGILLSLFGKEFILENSKNILLVSGVIILFSISLIVLLYIFRKRVLAGLGLNFETEIGINETSSKLVSSLIEKDSENLKKSAKDFTRNLVGKLLEMQARAWTFRIIFSLVAVLGGIFGTLIALQQNNIVKNQNHLIEEQGKYLLSMEAPFLNIEPYKFNWDVDENLVKVDLDLELINIGKRPATNIKYVLEFYEYIDSSKSIEPIEAAIEEEIINPLSPNSSIVINSLFYKKKNNSTVIVFFKSSFFDPIKNNEAIENEFIYKIPPPVYDPFIPTSLMVGNRIHKELLEEYLNK